MKSISLPPFIARRRRAAVRAALIVSALSPAVVCAQWPHRVDVDLLATDAAIHASGATVAADGNGGVFAVWNDRRNAPPTTNEDVFAQYYNAGGVAQWPANGVPVCVAPNQQNDAVAVNAGNGSVYIVWSDERGSANNERIFAQLLNAQGVAQWTANGIRVGPNEFDQTGFVAASDGAGGLLVCWKEVSNDFRTFVQKIDSSGARLWGASGFEFSSGVFEGGEAINVIPDGAGGAVVGWIRFGDNPRTVFMRRILATGAAAFATVGFGNDVDALHGSGLFPMPMTPDGTGGAILGWTVDNGTNDNLYIQRVDGTGALPWGTASKQLVDAPNVQDNLQIVADSAGGAYLAWDDPRTGVDNVYLQHVTAAGAFTFAANGLPVGVSTAQRFSARMIPDGNGGVIVSFRFNQEGTFAQRIDVSGTRLWGDDGAQLTDNGTTNFPTLTSDGRNGAILGALAFTSGNRAALKRIVATGELPASRLVNISTRAFVGVGANLAIPGFVIAGTGDKTLLIRAVGPTLGDPPFNVPGALADPVLTIFNAAAQPIHTRNNWGEAGDAALITTTSAALGAFPLPAGSNDAAIVVDLAPGLYTAGVTGAGGATGIGLVEVYDGDAVTSASRLINISSRVFVGTGAEVAIPGLVISGEATMTLLIRAVGPTLANAPFNVPGVLANPILTLFDHAGAALHTNDNWGDGGAAATVSAAAAAVGAFALPSGSLDAALVVTLPPGIYTASASGAGGGTGVCLVEAYLAP